MERVITLFKAASTDKGYHAVMINDQETHDSFVKDGWVDSADKIGEGLSDEEKELREEYEQLTGKKISGRAKMATIKKMLAEAKEAQDANQEG